MKCFFALIAEHGLYMTVIMVFFVKLKEKTLNLNDIGAKSKM